MMGLGWLGRDAEWLRCLKVCATGAEGDELAAAGEADDVRCGEVIRGGDALDFLFHAWFQADHQRLGECLFFVSRHAEILLAEKKCIASLYTRQEKIV
jgi:hypothetical protein